MSISETRDRLLEIALTLIWQSNYNSVGVNEICRQAGVTKGAFYHHFDSKASLFCEATRYYWEVVKTDLDSVFSPIHTPLEQLENLIRFLFVSKLGDSENAAPGCPFFNAGAQIGTDNPQVVEALQTLSSTAIKYNLALIKALNSGNFTNSGPDMEQQARLMYHFIHGAMSHAQMQSGVTTIDKDLSVGLYLLLGVKPEYWFSVEPTWQDEPKAILRSA